MASVAAMDQRAEVSLRGLSRLLGVSTKIAHGVAVRGGVRILALPGVALRYNRSDILALKDRCYRVAPDARLDSTN